jgi:hypothetical protein
MTSEFVIRVTFLEKPNNNDEFKIIMRNYILNDEDKKTLSTNSLGVKCDKLRYHNGQLVDFGSYEYSFMLELTMMNPQIPRKITISRFN